MAGVPELLILKLLAGREMYGYELAAAIRTVTNEGISLGEGVLYPALHALEQRGLLRSRRRAVGGRTRIYYSVTARGTRRLERLAARWRKISGAVEAALTGVSHA
jgi:PadR family transcriptional regulator PadR